MATAPATATYGNDPGASDLDRVRLETGDTDCSTAWLTDAEIRFFISEEPSILRAAARAAEAIAAKVASRVDFTHGPVKKTLSQLWDHYVALGKALNSKASLVGVVPVATGVDIAEKQAADADSSRVQPIFRKGEDDNPRAGPEPGPTTPDPSTT